MQRFSILVVLLTGLLVSCSGPMKYHFQEGPVYGSTYHIYYEYPDGKSLEKDILALLKRIDASMSTYNPGSLLSRLNRNDSTARLDVDLERVLKVGFEVSEKSGGAFDMTVAPLVNAWGFGFTAREKMTPQIVDSLLKITGYKKVTIRDGRLVKDNPGIMLDVNALAPGYASDVISELFESKGIRNYLVEIGGELRCLGVNQKGISWRVGIDKPLENEVEREIQEVLQMSRGSVATSGNYRKFYEEEGVKYSHTIDPKTGYPARSNLLSATVLTDQCIYADAWATVFMVIGMDKAIQLLKQFDGMEVLFIYSDEQGNLKEWQSPGMEALIYKSSIEAQEQPNPQSR